MAILSPNPTMEDLKITIQESTLIFPSQETQKKSMFLSNLDQFLNFEIATVHFFSASHDFPPERAVERLKIAVGKVLVPYDFLAGRLNWNRQLRRMEIGCNSAGAGFVVASSELSIGEIGDLDGPNVGFRQLAVRNLRELEDGDQPLCVFQVTSFKCGGFSIGISNNHMLLDGLSAKIFLQNLASQSFQHPTPLPFPPNHNRRLLAARSPPLVTFPHPELLKLDAPLPNLECLHQLDVRLLKLTPIDINFLKSKAQSAPHAATTFNVAAALLWRCRALSIRDAERDGDRSVSILTVMDIRSKVDPPLPPEFCGNAIITAYSAARCGDFEATPFGEMVRMVAEGQRRVGDEYVRSAVDWLEVNGGMPRGDLIVTSWMRLGFERVEFPWGKPVYSGPVVNRMEHLCWVYPVGDGVNILFQRPAEEMERFQFHFYDFFGHG